ITSTDPKVNNFASGIVTGYPKYKIETSIPDWTNYTSSFNVKPTDTKIEAYAIDGAGNISNTAVLNFIVDDTPPEISNISFDKNPDVTGWYNLTTGGPKIVIISNDTGSGIYEVRYSFDGINYNLYNAPIPVSEGKNINITIYVRALDNLRNLITNITNLPLINVDLTKPISTIQILPGRKFKITSIDGTSGIDKIWYQLDNNPPVQITEINENGETGEINIPVDTKQIKYWAIDKAGNKEDTKIYFIKEIKISGYIKDFSGNPISNIRVILTGEANRTSTTNAYGYYEFSNLSSLGYYFIIPSVPVSLPFIRGYDGSATTDLTDQNFIITNGWRFKEYDIGNTNDYYFKSNTILPSYSQLTLDWSVGLGGNILTGDLDYDGKLDLVIKGDYTGVVYHYKTGYIQKSGFSTTYN
ncbi:MAG: carboxypeptidase-like regulatory domain-containing protein, partial [bacterium]|nr:carboxypeptidase-like regulatory domain-containing protein [bacterium]MDW8163410.1 carboxypeptidase-like regulatory domain-containing protein [Candidatus Omnitrophota bacterium]